MELIFSNIMRWVILLIILRDMSDILLIGVIGWQTKCVAGVLRRGIVWLPIGVHLIEGFKKDLINIFY